MHEGILINSTGPESREIYGPPLSDLTKEFSFSVEHVMFSRDSTFYWKLVSKNLPGPYPRPTESESAFEKTDPQGICVHIKD